MGDEAIETIGGSGNVFRDFGYPDADVRQAKALLGTQIMKILDDEGLSTRQAEARTALPIASSRASAAPISPGSPLIG